MSNGLTKHLTRLEDAKLTRSLTPHLDIAELALAGLRRNVGASALMTGPEGARARLAIAVQEAIHRGMARELDAGAPESGLNHMMMKVLGDVVAGLSMRFSHDSPPARRVELVDHFIGAIAVEAREIVERADTLKSHEVAGVVASNPTKPGRS